MRIKITEAGISISGLKIFFAVLFTTMLSVVFVPVVFVFFVVLEWNFIVPLIQAGGAAEDRLRGHRDFQKHYMYYMTYPFIVCINGVRYAYRSIRDALD